MRCFLLIIVFPFYIFGQHNVGFKLNGGCSKINEKINSSYNYNFTYYFMPSFQGGFFYNYNFKKSLIGAELLFVQIQGKNYIEFPYMDQNGNPTGNSKNTVWQNISYLGIPVYYGINFKKININLGVQLNLLLTSSGHSESKGIYLGDSLNFKTTAKKLYMNQYDFGPRAAILFKVSKRFSFEGNYYYGLSNIYKDASFAMWRVQQITVGLRYSFYSKDKTITK